MLGRIGVRSDSAGFINCRFLCCVVGLAPNTEVRPSECQRDFFVAAAGGKRSPLNLRSEMFNKALCTVFVIAGTLNEKLFCKDS